MNAYGQPTSQILMRLHSSGRDWVDSIGVAHPIRFDHRNTHGNLKWKLNSCTLVDCCSILVTVCLFYNVWTHIATSVTSSVAESRLSLHFCFEHLLPALLNRRDLKDQMSLAFGPEYLHLQRLGHRADSCSASTSL